MSCSFDTSAPLGPTDLPPDATESIIDAGPTNADAGGEAKEHLLLSEVQPSILGFEYIEIHNPTTSLIELGNYYLSDTQDYALLPGEFMGDPEPDVGFTDFIVRFPEDATIAAGETQVIALRPGFLFEQTFDTAPNYRIGGQDISPKMRRAYQGSVGNNASITDGGEGLALFSGTAKPISSPTSISSTSVATPATKTPLPTKPASPSTAPTTAAMRAPTKPTRAP